MKKCVSALLLFTCIWISATAQEQKASTLSYSEAVKIGLQNNLTLNQQKNFLFARAVQKSQSVAAFLPSVNANGQIRHTDGTQPSPETGDLEDLTQDNINASIQANLTLFNGFSSVNTLNQNVNQFRAQTSLVRRTEQEVVFNIANQYLLVLLDQELLKISQESFRTQNVVLEQLREQVRLGARAEADLYAQDAQVRNLEVTVLRGKATLENDKALLAQILQLDPVIPIEVETPAFDTSYDPSNTPLDSLYNIALANREDLKQANYEVKGNLYGYRSSINGWLPSVSLFASYGSSYNSALKPIMTDAGQPVYGGFGNQFSRVFPTLAYGVQVNIPIFDRLVTRRNRVLNKVTYDNSILVRDNLEKTIKIEIKRTYNNYLTAMESYKASQIQYQAGELALKTQEESFMLGISAQVAVAQANQTFVQAASSRAQAQVTLIFQKMLLDYAMGTLNPQNIGE